MWTKPMVKISGGNSASINVMVSSFQVACDHIGCC